MRRTIPRFDAYGEKPWKQSAVTQFATGGNEQLPAQKAGGLYKINCLKQMTVL
jgi:hypothetical protein